MDVVLISKTFLSLFNTYVIAGISFIFYIFSKNEDKYKPLIALLFLTIMYNSVLKEIFKFELPKTCNANCYSFPSGHMNFFSIFYIWMIIKNRNKFVRCFLISILTLSGAAMVFAGYHHASDIIITPLFSISFILLYRYLELKLAKQILEFLISSLAFTLMLINYLMIGELQYHISLAFQVISGIYILHSPVKNLLKNIGNFMYFLVFLAIFISQQSNFIKGLCNLKFVYISLCIASLRLLKKYLSKKYCK